MQPFAMTLDSGLPPSLPRRCVSLQRLLYLLLMLGAVPVLAAPEVAVSIKPLQIIAAAITDGVTSPALVWSQGQDPHHVSLRVSERRLLARADLVLWIGPMLEQPLAGLVDELDARILTVQDMQGLTLIEVEAQPDPHVWVDTRNARLIATELAAALTALDPDNAPRYATNLTAFAAALAQLDQDLAALFATVKQRDWAVYHHALRYLEREFGLLPPLSLADNENNAPGLRTALQVRAQLQQRQVGCMLTEPGENHAEIATMLDLPALRLVEADVMGLSADAGDYPTYIRSLAATVRDCLEPAQ